MWVWARPVSFIDGAAPLIVSREMSAVRSIKLLIGLFGLAAVMTATPIEFSSDGLSLDTKVAAAKPGNGRG